jgi:hypothetical protein
MKKPKYSPNSCPLWPKIQKTALVLNLLTVNNRLAEKISQKSCPIEPKMQKGHLRNDLVGGPPVFLSTTFQNSFSPVSESKLARLSLTNNICLVEFLRVRPKANHRWDWNSSKCQDYFIF